MSTYVFFEELPHTADYGTSNGLDLEYIWNGRKSKIINIYNNNPTKNIELISNSRDVRQLIEQSGDIRIATNASRRFCFMVKNYKNDHYGEKYFMLSMPCDFWQAFFKYVESDYEKNIAVDRSTIESIIDQLASDNKDCNRVGVRIIKNMIPELFFIKDAIELAVRSSALVMNSSNYIQYKNKDIPINLLSEYCASDIRGENHSTYFTNMTQYMYLEWSAFGQVVNISHLQSTLMCYPLAMCSKDIESCFNTDIFPYTIYKSMKVNYYLFLQIFFKKLYNVDIVDNALFCI